MSYYVFKSIYTDKWVFSKAESHAEAWYRCGFLPDDGQLCYELVPVFWWFLFTLSLFDINFISFLLDRY